MLILLDLDGVIINWLDGVCKWFDIPYEPEAVTSWDIMPKLTETTKTEFWNKLNTPDFWEHLLDFYPDSINFIKELQKQHTVILCSSPAYGCAGYRQNWIQKNLPDFFYAGDYILTPNKWVCANKNTILIDDSDNNCDKFNELGNGTSILYPQPWNRNKDITTNKHKFILNTLKEIK